MKINDLFVWLWNLGARWRGRNTRCITRYEFYLFDGLARDINDMKKNTELNTDLKFFAETLSLYQWAYFRAGEGKIIVALDQKTLKYDEITLSGLEMIRYKYFAEQELNKAGFNQEKK